MPELSELLTIGQMSERLTEPGFSVAQAANQLRGFAKNELIFPHFVPGNGPTAPRFYTPDMMAVAKVLSELTFMGIADLKVMGAASLSMRTWMVEEEPTDWKSYIASRPKGGPMADAIAAFAADGGTWDYQLHFLQNDQTAQRTIRGYLLDSSREGIELPDPVKTALVPRGAVVIPLNPIFVRLFSDRAKAN